LQPSTLIRASGLAAVVGGLAFIMFPLLHPDHTPVNYASATWAPIHMLPNIGAILMLYGLVGLLVRQLDRAGWFGVVSFAVAFFGTASFVMGAMIEAFIIPFMSLRNPAIEDGPPPPGIAETFLAIGIIMALGHLLLAVATYRAAVLPRGVAVLMGLGSVAMLILQQVGMMFPSLDALWALGPVLQGSGLAWMGYALWSDTPAPQRRERRIVYPAARSSLAASTR